MSKSVNVVTPVCQATSVAAPIAPTAGEVARYFELLRQAIADTGWKYEPLAVYLTEEFRKRGQARSFDKSYVRRMVYQEKPLCAEVYVAFPKDIEDRHKQLQLEEAGFIVVEPVDDETAKRHLTIGLLNLFTPSRPLPAKALAMARADVATVARAVNE